MQKFPGLDWDPWPKDVTSPNATKLHTSKWPGWEPRCAYFIVMKNNNSSGTWRGVYRRSLYFLLFLM